MGGCSHSRSLPTRPRTPRRPRSPWTGSPPPSPPAAAPDCARLRSRGPRACRGATFPPRFARQSRRRRPWAGLTLSSHGYGGGMAQFVDWDLAAATAGALGKTGPRVTYQEAAEVVADLRRLAIAAAGHVQAFTGLT